MSRDSRSCARDLEKQCGESHEILSAHPAAPIDCEVIRTLPDIHSSVDASCKEPLFLALALQDNEMYVISSTVGRVFLPLPKFLHNNHTSGKPKPLCRKIGACTKALSYEWYYHRMARLVYPSTKPWSKL